jgi:hypothetical protein
MVHQSHTALRILDTVYTPLRLVMMLEPSENISTFFNFVRLLLTHDECILQYVLVC